MGPAESKSNLSQSIAEILGTAEPTSDSSIRPGPFRRTLIYSSMALLAINPAAVNAVGLGEIRVNSHLGQPLDATVPVTLTAGESLPKDCVAPTRGNSGIAAPGNLRVSSPAIAQPGTYNLRVTTANALHEPMYEISLLIDCPGTSVLLRQYVLMLDLPGMGAATPVAGSVESTARVETKSVNTRGDAVAVPAPDPQATARNVRQATNAGTSNRSDPRLLQSSGARIPSGKPYRVSKGDTLSTIASRIDGRSPDTTWGVANLIFSANPHAFIRNNPDLIKLGSMIDIPDVAALVGLEKGRMPIASVAAADTTSTTRNRQTGTGNVPRPAPVPAPVAASVSASRPEVLTSEPQAAQPEPTMLPNTEMTVVVMPEETARPVATRAVPATIQDSATATVANETVSVSPFLDESPAIGGAGNMPVSVAPAAASVPDEQTAPASTTTARNDNSGTVNSLLAIFVGMLIGLFMSLLIFRRQLIDAVMATVGRRISAKSNPTRYAKKSRARAGKETADDADLFEMSEAESAFASPQVKTEALPIGNPAENTYIVEASEAAATEKFDVPFVDPGKTAGNPDDEMLSMLFDENAQASGDETDAEFFDPTGGVETDVAGTFSDPTVEMPEWDEEENRTSGGRLSDSLEDDLPLDMLLDDTAEMPSNSVLDVDLDELSPADEEDLSESLQAAIALLEGDFNDEFTASQLLERTEVARSLNEADFEDADNLNPAKHKVSS